MLSLGIDRGVWAAALYITGKSTRTGVSKRSLNFFSILFCFQSCSAVVPPPCARNHAKEHQSPPITRHPPTSNPCVPSPSTTTLLHEAPSPRPLLLYPPPRAPSSPSSSPFAAACQFDGPQSSTRPLVVPPLPVPRPTPCGTRATPGD